MYFSHRSRVAVLGVALVTAGCSASIPYAYRGKFRDVTTGTELVLEKNHGALRFLDGRVLETDAMGLSFDELNAGQAGIYVVSESSGPMIDVHWISPVASSRQEEQQFAWYTTEYIRAAFDSRREDPVPVIGLTHCRSGFTQLDLPSRGWNMGCPEGAAYYDLRRVAE